MPMWRCPHCETPQAETARCWVCRRSSTACGTCRHFRRAVAANLGFCGLDRRRQPLVGDEIRPCWEAWPGGLEPLRDQPTIAAAAGPASSATPRIDFIEVDPGGVERGAPSERPAAASMGPGPAGAPPSEPRWSLWGDPDR